KGSYMSANRIRIGVILAVVVVALGLSTAVLPAAQYTTEGQLTWHATDAPFRLSYRQHGRTVTGEPGDTITGPGGSLAYQSGGSDASQAGASYHRLTNLIGSRPVPGGTDYRVGTDEPGRTADVAITHTAQGLRVHWTFTPSAGVTAVFEALAAGPAEHYLGGSSAAYVDLRGHVR